MYSMCYFTGAVSCSCFSRVVLHVYFTGDVSHLFQSFSVTFISKLILKNQCCAYFAGILSHVYFTGAVLFIFYRNVIFILWEKCHLYFQKQYNVLILQKQCHIYFTGTVPCLFYRTSIMLLLQEQCHLHFTGDYHLYFRNSIICLFYRGSITALKCLFYRSSTMCFQERYHMFFYRISIMYFFI